MLRRSSTSDLEEEINDGDKDTETYRKLSTVKEKKISNGSFTNVQNGEIQKEEMKPVNGIVNAGAKFDKNQDAVTFSELEMEISKNEKRFSLAGIANLPKPVTSTVRYKGPLGQINKCMDGMEVALSSCFTDNSGTIKILFKLFLFVALIGYVIFSCKRDFKGTQDLFFVACFTLFCILYSMLKTNFGETISRVYFAPVHKVIMKKWKPIKWLGILLFLGFVIFWVVYDVSKEPERLTSLGGLFVYIFIGFITSKNRSQIRWRPVIWGFSLQFTFGLIILRTSIGLEVFRWLSAQVSAFLKFSDAGAEFVFGKELVAQTFAFGVLPVIVFFSSFTYTLYYLGWMQVVIKKIAWLLQVTLGTSPSESVSGAGNIFVGQTEAPLLIRPFLAGMTTSELHAVMTGGFATISGSVLGAFIKFGISPSHLISASVMAAPAALAMSKLMYPETEESALKSVDDIQIEKGEEKNVFEALAQGASLSIGLVANIAVMQLAFVSMLAFFNQILNWMGTNAGYDGLTFQKICSYILAPFAFVMGVNWDDSFVVGELIGTKLFLNEFVAFDDLAKKHIANGNISARSQLIATYALCGFANFSSMGVQIGGISSIEPSTRPKLAKIAFRALMCGTMATMTTACMAGILVPADHANGANNTTTTISPAYNTSMFTPTLPINLFDLVK